jgi:hypothetical protein
MPKRVTLHLGTPSAPLVRVHMRVRGSYCTGWAFTLAALLLMASSSVRAPVSHGLAGSRVVRTAAHESLWLDGGYAHASVAPTRPVSKHQFWQVGLMASPEASQAVAMRTSIVTRLSQRVVDRTTDYFWIGSYLADASFIQIGYYISSSDPRHSGWFFCAYTAHGDQGPCVYGPAGSAGGDGETHTYSLEVAQPIGRAPAAQAGPATWLARVDGAVVGRFKWTSGTTGPNSPSIYAESSGFTPHPATSQLGPVDFPVAVQTRAAGQLSYVTATHLQPMYVASDVCPPYGVAADGHGGVLLGSGLPCASGDGWLR